MNILWGLLNLALVGYIAFLLIKAIKRLDKAHEKVLCIIGIIALIASLQVNNNPQILASDPVEYDFSEKVDKSFFAFNHKVEKGNQYTFIVDYYKSESGYYYLDNVAVQRTGFIFGTHTKNTSFYVSPVEADDSYTYAVEVDFSYQLLGIPVYSKRDRIYGIFNIANQENYKANLGSEIE
jgi:hypothetical protein